MLVVIGICAIGWSAQAQTYDHVIPTSQTLLDGATTTVSPGDVIGVDAGERGRLSLRNIHGTAADPVIIINKGGQVRIANNGSGEGINISNCSYFELRGDGDPAFRYGFDVYKAGGQCIKVGGLSTDFRICFVEVSNPGFAGIMAKTDPGAGGYAVRGSFTQYNTIIHDVYAHDIPGEAFYVGNSFYASGTPDGYLPNDLVGVRIYNNLTERCGREGIQVGSATSDCEIYDNVVLDSGLLGISGQQNGIQIGEGTTGKCYGNIVRNAGANGIVVLGIGNNLVFNNVVENTGTNGFFCDNRAGAEIPGSYVRLYNNTIVNPTKDGALFYNEVTVNEFKNNIVVGSDPAYGAVSTGSGATVTSANNTYQVGTTGLAFANMSLGDYRILSTSPAVDAGTNLSPDVTADLEGLARPFGPAYDTGAYEAGALSVVLFTDNPTIHGATDGAISASALGGTAPYTYTWSNSATTASISGLGAGTYTVTVTDAVTASVVRTVTLNQPPELVVNEQALPELAGNNDGSITLQTSGGTLPVSVVWAHGPTTSTISGLPAGFYSYVVTDANGAQVGRTVYVRDAGTPIYRVNNGGIEETDRVLDWSRDKGTSTDKSPYVVNTGNKTTGSNQWGEATATEAPQDIFGSRRYISSASITTMDWEFPVATGFYEVQLYFNEIDSAITGPGDRMFDVEIESELLADDLDIFALHGASTPAQHNFLVYVDDGTLDLDFVENTGAAMVSGISIHALGSDLPVGTPLYRVNNGGIEETGSGGVNWLKDKKTDPVSFLASTGQLTTGSNSWNSGGSNLTDAPDDVFGNWRYAPLGGNNLQWEFPVDDGVYRVNLYFIERDATVTVGDRVFSVTAEAEPFLTDHDIFDAQGYLVPGGESMILQVDDGTLDLEFTASVGTTLPPLINAISVHRVQ